MEPDPFVSKSAQRQVPQPSQIPQPIIPSLVARLAKLSRDELVAENQAMYEEMVAMELQQEQTLAAAVEALEQSARFLKERRALEREIENLHKQNELLESEKDELKREKSVLKSDIEQFKQDNQAYSVKAIHALKDRESMKLQLIQIESETAKLLAWLIEEGRILDQDDDAEKAPEPADEDETEDSVKINALRMMNSTKGPSPQLSRKRRSTLGASKLGAGSSLKTLYAASIANSGTLVPLGTHNRLISNSSSASIDNMAASKSYDTINGANQERNSRMGSIAHLQLSVCSLSKASESKIPSSLTNLEGRILAQISQITELLKAVLSLQEETAKQLWESKKKVKRMEVASEILGAWRTAVMTRVGEANIDKVPITPSLSDGDTDPLESTRNVAKKLHQLTRKVASYLMKMEA